MPLLLIKKIDCHSDICNQVFFIINGHFFILIFFCPVTNCSMLSIDIDYVNAVISFRSIVNYKICHYCHNYKSRLVYTRKEISEFAA